MTDENEIINVCVPMPVYKIEKLIKATGTDNKKQAVTKAVDECLKNKKNRKEGEING